MASVSRLALVSLSLFTLASVGSAQPPREGAGRPGRGGDLAASSVKDRIVARLMKFDKNKDGKLSRKEITDERLLRLFDRADGNKDGTVTKVELEALATKMAAEEGDDGPRGRFGPPGGPGGPGGPPRPGQILPPFLQEWLNLSAKQKKQLDSLQKEVDSKLAKILTPEQKKQLEKMRGFGGGPGGRGAGGPGPRDRGPGGPPPG